MLKKAIEKLEAEITVADKDDEYTPFIGSQVMDHIRKNPNDAVLILADNKTIKGSISAMSAEAEKKKKNGRSMFTPAQGMAIVMKYYGINVDEPNKAAPAASRFSTSLDDIF